MIRKTVIFSGHVQGVGFRYTTQAVAQRFAVTGFVRNLPDGRVELVAEGDAAELVRFVDAVQSAMSGHIRSLTQSDSPAGGQFSSFAIRTDR